MKVVAVVGVVVVVRGVIAEGAGGWGWGWGGRDEADEEERSYKNKNWTVRLYQEAYI